MKLSSNLVLAVLHWPAFILIAIMILGCNDDSNMTPANEDEYYVRYEIDSESSYPTTRYVTLNLDNNISNTFNFRSTTWETIIGPVKKGFTAKLLGGYTDQTITNSYIDAKIHVSKNNSPFALKKFNVSSSPRTLVEVNYTIDF